MLAPEVSNHLFVCTLKLLVTLDELILDDGYVDDCHLHVPLCHHLPPHSYPHSQQEGQV